jgi:hypothetical protein
MITTPTLQELAFYARDHFGEDGYSLGERAPSTFEVVVDVFSRTTPGTGELDLQSYAGALVQERLRETFKMRGVPADVCDYVRMAIKYLRCQYPAAHRVNEDRELLGRLFWGHLVEARLAPRRSRVPVAV